MSYPKWGVYKLTNLKTRNVLSLSDKDRTTVSVSPSGNTGGKHERWLVEPRVARQDYFTLRNELNGDYLRTPNSSDEPGTRLQVLGGSREQTWLLKPAGPNTYVLLTPNKERVVGPVGGNGSGTSVGLYEKGSGGDDQKWLFERVADS